MVCFEKNCNLKIVFFWKIEFNECQKLVLLDKYYNLKIVIFGKLKLSDITKMANFKIVIFWKMTPSLFTNGIFLKILPCMILKVSWSANYIFPEFDTFQFAMSS